MTGNKSASYTLLIFFNLFLLSGCMNKNKDSKLLQLAIKSKESNSTLALKFIDSISDPEGNLSTKNYMQYLVTRTQLRHKNYIPIENDSLIFKAVDYYQKNKKNPQDVALANYYAGSVLRQQKKFDQAIKQYKIAETYGRQSNDLLLLGLIRFNIADLLSEQGNYKNALLYYESASQMYKTNPEKLAHCYSSMGRMYLFSHNTDSAILYFQKGFKIADGSSDKKLKRQLAESLSVANEQIKNYKEAQKYLYYSLSFNTDSTKLPRYNLNFALLYSKMQNSDSTFYYANKLTTDLKKIKDKYLIASILNFLINYEKNRKNLTAAFHFQSQRMEIVSQIMKERERQTVYEIEQKFNYEHIKKEYYKSILKTQYWIIFLMGTIITGGISFLLYRKRQKNRQTVVLNRIQTLKEMKYDLELLIQKKQVDLRRQLLWRFGITKKFLRLNEEINKKGKSSTESGFLLKKFNNIVYGQSSPEEQWDTLHETFKQTRPGYSEKIKQVYPEISETEFRICILTYADFNVKEIALVLKKSPNTIQTGRTSLRKKLGLDSGGNIAESIDKLPDC